MQLMQPRGPLLSTCLASSLSAERLQAAEQPAEAASPAPSGQLRCAASGGSLRPKTAACR